MELKTLKTNDFLGVVPRIYNDENKYYLYDDTKSALIEVSIASIELCFKTGQIVYNLKHGSEDIAVIAKKDFESKFTLKLYGSELAYMENTSLAPATRIFEPHCIVRSLDNTVNAPTIKSETGEFEVHAYAMENGKPVMIDVLERIEGITVVLDNANGRVLRRFLIGFMLNNDIDLEHTYQTKEQLFNYESVLVIEESGKSHYTDAKYASLVLTDEQKELVRNFEKAKKALNDAGVILCYNSEDDTTSAINRTAFKHYASGYDPSEIASDLENRDVLTVDSIHGSAHTDYCFDVYLNGENNLYLWNE